MKKVFKSKTREFWMTFSAIAILWLWPDANCLDISLALGLWATIWLAIAYACWCLFGDFERSFFKTL